MTVSGLLSRWGRLSLSLRILIGLASYFAKAQTALPFLMDQFEIPQDLFQLYIPTSIVNGKFDTLVSAVNRLAFSLIGTIADTTLQPWTRCRISEGSPLA